MPEIKLDTSDIDAKFWALVKLEEELYKQTQSKLEEGED